MVTLEVGAAPLPAGSAEDCEDGAYAESCMSVRLPPAPLGPLRPLADSERMEGQSRRRHVGISQPEVAPAAPVWPPGSAACLPGSPAPAVSQVDVAIDDFTLAGAGLHREARSLTLHLATRAGLVKRDFDASGMVAIA